MRSLLGMMLVVTAVLTAPAARASVVGATMICSTLTPAQVRAVVGVKRRIAAWCTDYATGEVVGALLRTNGLPSCEIHGIAIGATCARVSICGGAPVTACL